MWPTRPPPFAVKKGNIPIEKAEAKHGVRANISSASLFPGNVSLYEEFEAMHYANYNLKQWHELEASERAFHVAHYRNVKLVDLHIRDTVATKEEQEMKKNSRKK